MLTEKHHDDFFEEKQSEFSAILSEQEKRLELLSAMIFKLEHWSIDLRNEESTKISVQLLPVHIEHLNRSPVSKIVLVDRMTLTLNLFDG